MDSFQISSYEEKIGKAVVNAAYKVHKELGPGLLERVCEVCLTHELIKEGFDAVRQVSVPIKYDNLVFEEGLIIDILVEGLVIVELKAVNIVNPVWEAQIISHLKLADKKLGYLINFNVPLIKEGIRRYINRPL